MDNFGKNMRNNGGSSRLSGPLIDIPSSDISGITISPNAVRNRIGTSPNSSGSGLSFTQNTSSSNGAASLFIGSNQSSNRVPGIIQRATGSSSSNKNCKANEQPPNVIDRHLVRRTYEEQYHSTRQIAVGCRLAADVSPDGSIVGDITADNFDSMSLQLSPQLNRRNLSPSGTSSTVPSTPARQPQPHSHQLPADLLSLQGDLNAGEFSDSALQLQAELKRTLESSNSTFTSLVDLSAPVTKWKRAMSLPQNDFARAMCHKAVAKSLAQNIRSALRSSPATIKESLAPGELQPPIHEQVLLEQLPEKLAEDNNDNVGKLISPQRSPQIKEACISNNKASENPADKNDPDGVWVLRESFVDQLGDTNRRWKTQQMVEEQLERRLKIDSSRRISEVVKAKQENGHEFNEAKLSVILDAAAGPRRRSQDSDIMEKPKNDLSSRYHYADNGPSGYSKVRSDGSSGLGHSQNYHHATGNISGEELSDFSDREEEAGTQQPSLLQPLSNFLAGRKGAYAKVATHNENSPQHHANPRHVSSQYAPSSSHRQMSVPHHHGGNGQDRRRNSTDRQSDSEKLAQAFRDNEGHEEDLLPPPERRNPEDYDTDEETDKLLEKGYQTQRQVQFPELAEHALSENQKKVSMKEVRLADPDHPSVLLEGVLFRCRYLGSTQLVSDSQPNKSIRMMQAQEAVGRIKAPFGEAQPSSEVDLFISFEKVMVLSTNLQDIIMDHALKTISYVADLEDVVVLMTRRRQLPESNPTGLAASSARGPQIKMLCHVFESEDAHHISDAIGEAFHLAYMSFLRANGIEDPSALREVDMGEENIGPQDIFNDDLPRFVDKNHQKDVVISKPRGEPLGVVVVESGWGSVIPTVVLANMLPTGPAARSGQLNIGDQLLSVNGVSLVGLPMTSCQNYIKAAKNQTAVRVTLIRCPPVTEVLIKRPDVKYQLGFSVHNGIICSLLRGGIAERGGVRVGHRIIEINGESVVAVSHDRIVNLLSSSLGEIRMKTMPMSIFRLLTGQDTPTYI